MKRKIIYTLYTMCDSFFVGFLPLVVVHYMIFGIVVLPIMNLIGAQGLLFNGFLWSIIGCFLFFRLGMAGRKIEAEKAQFERWRDILTADTSSIEQKERVAWKILGSPDLNKFALDNIVMHTYPNTPVNDKALEKINELQKPISHEQRN